MFPILHVPPGSARTSEPLGTKFKFWFTDVNYGLALFKEGRPGTGENWAEKIACELAELIELPHAKYELAEYEGRQGVVSLSLVDKSARVVHGNELLGSFVTDYMGSENTRYRNPSHTLRRVVAYLRASAGIVGAPYSARQTERLRSALDFFIGYLMFDTWIANQDRHDENWAILRTNDAEMFLAPSFDHGSSMARNEPDARRELRLTTRDKGMHISTFVQKARSGLYPNTPEVRSAPLYTLEAFTLAAAHSPGAAEEWKERLAAVGQNHVRAIIDAVPDEWMSQTARKFTLELLRLNQERILNTRLT